MKFCQTCNIEKPFTEYYTLDRIDKDGNPFTYYRLDCKDCIKLKAKKWKADNPEKFKESKRKQSAKPKNKKIVNERNKKFRESGYYLNWQRNNKDKIKVYTNQRVMNKKHEINNKDWLLCKEYFNNCCAYCGLHASKHYNYFNEKLQLQDLQKDHVYHEGSNDIFNCVPSCKSCNSSKHTSKLLEWYTKEKAFFTYERLNRIYEWLLFDVYTIEIYKVDKK